MKRLAYGLAIVGFVAAMTVAVCVVETPHHAEGEFYRRPLPEIGTEYEVVEPWLAARKREDLKYLVPPYSLNGPENVADMLETGEAIRLQPGDRVTLLEIEETQDTKSEARIATPYGECWTVGLNFYVVERSRPIR